jgi:hypothetical protein
MTAPDYAAERTRLAGVYAAMTDEELTKIAESGDDLTVPAQDALLAKPRSAASNLSSQHRHKRTLPSRPTSSPYANFAIFQKRCLPRAASIPLESKPALPMTI